MDEKAEGQTITGNDVGDLKEVLGENDPVFDAAAPEGGIAPAAPDLDTGIPIEKPTEGQVPTPMGVDPGFKLDPSLSADPPPPETDEEFRERVNKTLARIETKMGKMAKQLGL